MRKRKERIMRKRMVLVVDGGDFGGGRDSVTPRHLELLCVCLKKPSLVLTKS